MRFWNFSFIFKAGFHCRRSHSRNRNQRCRAIRSGENQIDGVGRKTLTLTPSLMIKWKLSVVAGNFALSFSLKFLSIFVDISGFIKLIILIWAPLKRSFSPVKLEYGWRQFWSKVMTSEVKQSQPSWRPVMTETGVSGLSAVSLSATVNKFLILRRVPIFAYSSPLNFLRFLLVWIDHVAW